MPKKKIKKKLNDTQGSTRKVTRKSAQKNSTNSKKILRATIPDPLFSEEKVNQAFEGELTYVGRFCMKKAGPNTSFSVFHNAKPNREKSHKEYLLLYSHYSPIDEKTIWFVSGMDQKDMEKERYQTALHCKKCGDIIYSEFLHDYHTCKCGTCAIDGGKSYNHINGNPEDYELVTIDLLNDGIVVGIVNPE